MINNYINGCSILAVDPQNLIDLYAEEGVSFRNVVTIEKNELGLSV